jgi:hypothetical protein
MKRLSLILVTFTRKNTSNLPDVTTIQANLLNSNLPRIREKLATAHFQAWSIRPWADGTEPLAARKVLSRSP